MVKLPQKARKWQNLTDMISAFSAISAGRTYATKING